MVEFTEFNDAEKLKLFNELERGGIYGMTYETYIYIAGDGV